MANQVKGETPFLVGSEAYVLLFDINALISIQEETGVKAQDLGTAFAEGADLKLLRTLFRIGLADRHPDLSDLEVGRLLHQVGLQPAVEKLGEALRAAFPDATPNPPQGARKKTGTSSAS